MLILWILIVYIHNLSKNNNTGYLFSYLRCTLIIQGMVKSSINCLITINHVNAGVIASGILDIYAIGVADIDSYTALKTKKI